jgi:hypothetical protein
LVRKKKTPKYMFPDMCKRRRGTALGLASYKDEEFI